MWIALSNFKFNWAAYKKAFVTNLPCEALEVADEDLEDLISSVKVKVKLKCSHFLVVVPTKKLL